MPNDVSVAPVDAYAQSKAEAEASLATLAEASGIDLVVIRPPLVYGPGVGGNIQALVRLIRRGLWLPLRRASENRGSMISTVNLSSVFARRLRQCVPSVGRSW